MPPLGWKTNTNGADPLARLNALCGSASVLEPQEPSCSSRHRLQPVPRRGPHKAEHMRAMKAVNKCEDSDCKMQLQKESHHDSLALLAEIGGIHVAANSSASKSAGKVHGKSWSTLSFLRSAFSPVSSTAYATVMEVGRSMPRDNRALLAEIIKTKQSEGVKRLFVDPAPPGKRWAIYGKMHDCTKLKLTLPHGMVTKIDGDVISTGDVVFSPLHTHVCHIVC